jgi:hypothetical protein
VLLSLGKCEPKFAPTVRDRTHELLKRFKAVEHPLVEQPTAPKGNVRASLDRTGNTIRHLSCFLALMTLLASLGTMFAFSPAANAQAAVNEGIDFAALAIRPTDFPAPGWRHAGAFVDGLGDTANIVADYRGRGTDPEDVAAALAGFGWQRTYVANVVMTKSSNPGELTAEARSYITVYADPQGATAGFTYLEDESGITGAKDVSASRTFGEFSEVTSERGTDQDGRPFRSLDLTFRIDMLIAGVTLIQYPTNLGVDPDPAELERLAAILEQRVGNATVGGSTPGAAVLRLDPATAGLVTYDDAYYRLEGVDIPQFGELDDQAAGRIQTYREAVDVYQLWQGVPNDSEEIVLYGVTLLRFPDEAAAANWTGDLSAILATNSFYSNLSSRDLRTPVGEQTVALDYRAGGPTGPSASLIAVRVGAVVARIHLVSAQTVTEIPASALVAIASAQAACLSDPASSHTARWPTELAAQ